MTFYRQTGCNFTIMRKLLVFIIIMNFGLVSQATHIVGGEFSYVCGANNQYTFLLNVYRDCRPPSIGGGTPSALQTDDPAYIAIYSGNGSFVDSFRVRASKRGGDTVPLEFNNNCVTNVPTKCLNRLQFTFTRTLPPNTTGYNIVFQRCCRNGATLNINNGGATGASFYCTVPPAAINCNNSAVYTNAPPQIVCINNPLVFDCSATDLDGDSLSYEFCPAVIGGSQNDPAPNNTTDPPPYASVNYRLPYSANFPIAANPPFSIDPRTGVITGTPTLLGIFAITVCCKEWRNGVVINTIRREFQVDVTNCSKAVIADFPVLSQEPNTYIINCDDSTVFFQNNSKGGFTYWWDFGVPGITTDVSNLKNPTYTYPDTGTYNVKLIVNPGSTCPDSITRIVKIYPKFNTDFTFSGDFCPEVPINFTDLSSSTLYPPNFWSWNFDDGRPNESIQNPVHLFPNLGKEFNVRLVSGNQVGCRDTTTKTIKIALVELNAGNDTTVVQLEDVQLNATGTQTYSWVPSTFLNNSLVSNPIGNFPNTGVFTYVVEGVTADGCPDKDTINITVSERSYVIVPNAFSPNGDGRNDVLRMLSSGFPVINYFRIFNRWGQKVFETNDYYQSWDGKFKGVDQPISTFYWVISVVDLQGNEQIFRGDVTIVR